MSKDAVGSSSSSPDDRNGRSDNNIGSSNTNNISLPISDNNVSTTANDSSGMEENALGWTNHNEEEEEEEVGETEDINVS